MTYLSYCTLLEGLLDQIAEHGLGVVPDLIRSVIKTAMDFERQQFLSPPPHEDSAERRGLAFGYKPKTITTCVGPVTFDIPQVRQGGLNPQAKEKVLLGVTSDGNSNLILSSRVHVTLQSHRSFMIDGNWIALTR